jgi:hypothetical protein
MAREEGFFDELARGLAEGSITRGKALRLMGAALVGGTLASLGIGEAGADPPGCKRAGKHCTRSDQCCGSLVCLSGTCQTPATSTTETPTTSTTETPTTSTSTSTTSTSTTSPCLPDGASCTSGGTPCCSGFCSGDSICAQPKGIATCHCVDGATLPGICTDDCSVTQEEVCVPFCANHGGAEPAGCDGPVAC